MNKTTEVIKAIEAGAIFIEKRTPNFGTNSLTRPIQRGLPDRKTYLLNNESIHPTTGKSVINSGMLCVAKTERSGLSTLVTYKIKEVGLTTPTKNINSTDPEERLKQLRGYLQNIKNAINGILSIEKQRNGLSEAMQTTLVELRMDDSSISELIKNYETGVL